MALYYTEEHEWLDVEGEIATLGITAYAAEQLGDVVFVELREEGEEFEKGDEIAIVESVKAASELYAPLACEIIEANKSNEETPAAVNESPEENAWFYKIRIKDVSELDDLMDADAYKVMIS